MKKIILALLLISSVAQANTRGVVTTLTTSPNGDATLYSWQRKVVFANGLFWVMWAGKGSDLNLWYTTSPDGVTWTTQGALVPFGEGQFGNQYAFDSFGTTLFEVLETSTDQTTLYRKSTLNSDGSVTSGSYSTAISDTGSANSYEVFILADSTSLPWIGLTHAPNGAFTSPLNYIITTSTSNTNWSSTVGFPVSGASQSTAQVQPVGAAQLSGKTYWVYTTDSLGLAGIEWNGSSFGSQETVVSNALATFAYTTLADGDDIHAVYLEAGDHTIRYRKRTSGTWGTEVTIATLPASPAGTIPVIVKYGTAGYRVYWQNYSDNKIYSADIVNQALVAGPTAIQDESSAGFVSGNYGGLNTFPQVAAAGATNPMLVYVVNGSGGNNTIISLIDTSAPPAPPAVPSTILFFKPF